MKYTETWTWTKGIRYYTSSKLPKTYLEPWMEEYRDKIQAIKTDEQAAHAIQAYWRDVVKDWQEHLATKKEV